MVDKPVVDSVHPQSNNLIKGVKIKVTGDSKLDSTLVMAFEEFLIFSCVLV